MANKYDKEITKNETQRDSLTLAQITVIYGVIRDKIQKLAMNVTDQVGDNTEWFSERNRATRFATKVNDELRPEYLKRDAYSKKTYTQEYNTAYYQAKYGVENLGLSDGFSFNLPKYTDKQFETARDYALSKLMNSEQLKAARSVQIQQLYTTIVSGVDQGLSLANINKNLDINLGYRNAAGKWIADTKLRKGQQYNTMRILRTEVLRMRSNAETQQWINQQSVVPSQLQLVETLDSRIRSQSASMDGQIANSEGKFRFPNGQYSYAHQSGVAKWDINDRSSTNNVNPDYPPSTRIQRDKDGNNITLPYENFESYAKKQGLVKNIYGQVLFPSK